jgi:hypothetical protein
VYARCQGWDIKAVYGHGQHLQQPAAAFNNFPSFTRLDESKLPVRISIVVVVIGKTNENLNYGVNHHQSLFIQHRHYCTTPNLYFDKTTLPH